MLFAMVLVLLLRFVLLMISCLQIGPLIMTVGFSQYIFDVELAYCWTDLTALDTLLFRLAAAHTTGPLDLLMLLL